MKLTDIIKEYVVNKPETNRPPALLEVVKERYLCIDRVHEGDYYTKDEIDNFFYSVFTVGDVWKLVVIDREYYYKCIKGEHKGESNEEAGWEYNDSTKDFFKVLKR